MNMVMNNKNFTAHEKQQINRVTSSTIQTVNDECPMLLGSAWEEQLSEQICYLKQNASMPLFFLGHLYWINDLTSLAEYLNHFLKTVLLDEQINLAATFNYIKLCAKHLSMVSQLWQQKQINDKQAIQRLTQILKAQVVPHNDYAATEQRYLLQILDQADATDKYLAFARQLNQELRETIGVYRCVEHEIHDLLPCVLQIVDHELNEAVMM